MMDFESIRAQSLIQAGALGYPVNKSLPLLDRVAVCRSRDEVIDRLFAMHCATACAYGFDRRRARAWLNREAKVDCLTATERDFLETGEGDRDEFRSQIEAIWALMWTIGGAATLDFSAACADDFVKRMPDLKTDESSKAFRDRAKLRELKQIVAACDLAYCLHWAIRDAQFKRATMPGTLHPAAVIERRRALEWLLTEDDWEEISLDT